MIAPPGDDDEPPPPPSRWEPFILGIIASVITSTDFAQAIGLTFVGAWPDEIKPMLIVATDRSQYSDASEPQQFRVTVERVP